MARYVDRNKLPQFTYFNHHLGNVNESEPWCNYIDIDKQAIMEYQVLYIPSIFIMDASGKIIAEKLRGKDLSDFIDKLFAE